MVAPLIILGGVAVVSMIVASAKNASAVSLAPVDAPQHIAPPPTAPTTAAPKAMSAEQQKMMANAIKLLRVQNDGSIKGPVTVVGMRTATQIAGRLDAAGFTQAAETLRSLCAKAAPHVAEPREEDKIPLPAELSADMQDRVQRMIQSERDPAKLSELVAALEKLPQSATRDMAVGTLKALILQIEQANIQRNAMEEANRVMNAPTGTVPPPTASTPKQLPEVVEPAPAPTPAPKSAAQQLGDSMALHLKSVQSKHGMPAAKGKEDASIVARFQSKAGLKADGKAGPGTLAKAASLGVSALPLVMYWPAGSSRSSVQVYRDTLRRLAGQASEQGFDSLANELRMVASYERGQGGIAEYGPALS